MPDWLHYVTSPWTTPATLVAVVVGVVALCRVRGRRLAMVAAAMAAGVAMWQAWRSGPPSGLLDLQIYAGAARSWWDGRSLYDFHDPRFNLTATYPPIGPLLFTPIIGFGDELREITFTAISLGALWFAARSTAVLAGIERARRTEWTLWAFAAATVTLPVWLTLRLGQINIVLWALVLLDLVAIARARRWSGLGIGLATAIKLVPGLFIVWAALTRRATVVLRALVALVVATGIGWALAPSDSRRYWTDLLWDSGHVGRLDDPRNNSIMGVLARALPEGHLRTTLWMLAVAAIAAVGLTRSVRASRAGDLLAVAAIVGCTASAISPISWSHHLGFLLVALAACVTIARSTTAKILCILAFIALVDPGGHGDEAWLSTARALLVVVAVVGTPIVPGRTSTLIEIEGADSGAA